MKKNILQLFILILIVFSGLLYYRYKKNPTQLVPHPFLVPNYQLTAEEKKEIEQSHVLIIGDSLGQLIGPFLPGLEKDLKKNLSVDISIYNWSEKNQGIHRSLAKLRSLRKLPPLIIFLGGNDEFFESKFDLKDFSAIQSNYNLYSKSVISSLLFFFPILSRFFYTPVQYQNLANLVEAPWPKDKMDIQKFRQINYLIYQYYLEEFIDFIEQKGPELLLVTPPINRELAIDQNCYKDFAPDYFKKLDQAQSLFGEKSYKTVLSILEKFKSKGRGHGSFQHLLGLTYYNMGKLNKAWKFLNRGMALDCGKNKGLNIFSSQMRYQAKHLDIEMIDFDRDLFNEMKNNPVFLFGNRPQELYLKNLGDQIGQKIKTMLKLNP